MARGVNDAPTRRRLVAASLAALVVAAGAALYICLRDPSKHVVPGGLRGGSEVLDLDLGLGRDRGGKTVLVLPASAGLREVTLSFVVPVTPGALYHVEVRGPAEELLIRYERAPIVLDDLGGAQVRVPAFRFAKEGGHQLILRQFAPDGGVREYRYPFRVMRPA